MPALTTILILTLLWTGTNQVPDGPPVAHDEDVQIRINGPIRVGAQDTASTVWVVNDDATIEGVVHSGLVVINGLARVTGRVEGGIVVVNGRLDLGPGARVGRDIMLYRSTITRSNDAIVAGAVHSETGFSIGAGAIWLVWLSLTVVVVVAGVVFAELAPTALAESATDLTARFGRSMFVALLVAGAVPALAIMSFATVIGIPLGLMLLFVVIPSLSLLGYLVSGAALGSAVVTRLSSARNRMDRYAPVIVGLVLLQCLVALPVLGGLIGMLASLLGFGALVGRAWARRQRLVPATVPAAVGA